MRKFIDSIVTLIIAIVGLVGGFIWAYNSDFDYEPVILMIVSGITITSFIISRSIPSKELGDNEGINNKASNKNEQKVEVNVRVGETNTSKKETPNANDRNAIIESKKEKVNILFIDDDTKFNVVKILKDSGWKNTKTVVDVKSIDVPVVQKSDIVFVDINGVGKLLQLEYEGLDLALMLKQKYTGKKVIIYSANKNTNAFHQAWDIIDKRLEKNALPYQFQNLVENYSLEFYN